MKTLFEFAILLHPSSEIDKTILLVFPTPYLAADYKTAALYASTQIPKEYIEVLDRVEVLVRPFYYYNTGNTFGVTTGTTILTIGNGNLLGSGISVSNQPFNITQSFNAQDLKNETNFI